MKTRDIHIRISEERFQQIKKLADEQYRKFTSIIDMALDAFFKSEKDQKKIDQIIAGAVARWKSGWGTKSREAGRDHSDKNENPMSHGFVVLKKYNNRCAICGKKDFPYKSKCKSGTFERRFLEIHHIDGNPVNNQISNLILLCKSCHRKEQLKLRKG